MGEVVLRFDTQTIRRLTEIHALHNPKAAIFKGVRWQYVRENPGEVAKKTALVSLPAIAVGAAAGAGAGVVAAGGVGAPFAVPLGAGIGAAGAAVAGVFGSVVWISRSGHYKAWEKEWERQLPDICLPSIIEKFTASLDEEDKAAIVCPISGRLILLPVKASGDVLRRGDDPETARSVIYDYDAIVERIQSKKGAMAASINGTCDFKIDDLIFDFETAETIIKVLKRYKSLFKAEKTTLVALHLIERELYSKICSLWLAEDKKIQKSWHDGRISAAEYSQHSIEVQEVFRLREIVRILAEDPLSFKSVDQLLMEARGESSESGVTSLLEWIIVRMKQHPQITEGVSDILAHLTQDPTTSKSVPSGEQSDEIRGQLEWIGRLMMTDPKITRGLAAYLAEQCNRSFEKQEKLQKTKGDYKSALLEQQKMKEKLQKIENAYGCALLVQQQMRDSPQITEGVMRLLHKHKIEIPPGSGVNVCTLAPEEEMNAQEVQQFLLEIERTIVENPLAASFIAKFFAGVRPKKVEPQVAPHSASGDERRERAANVVPGAGVSSPAEEQHKVDQPSHERNKGQLGFEEASSAPRAGGVPEEPPRPSVRHPDALQQKIDSVQQYLDYSPIMVTGVFDLLIRRGIRIPTRNGLPAFISKNLGRAVSHERLQVMLGTIEKALVKDLALAVAVADLLATQGSISNGPVHDVQMQRNEMRRMSLRLICDRLNASHRVVQGTVTALRKKGIEIPGGAIRFIPRGQNFTMDAREVEKNVEEIGVLIEDEQVAQALAGFLAGRIQGSAPIEVAATALAGGQGQRRV